MCHCFTVDRYTDEDILGCFWEVAEVKGTKTWEQKKKPFNVFLSPLAPCDLFSCASGQAPDPWVPCLRVDHEGQVGPSPQDPLAFLVVLGVLWGQIDKEYKERCMSTQSTRNCDSISPKIHVHTRTATTAQQETCQGFAMKVCDPLINLLCSNVDML